MVRIPPKTLIRKATYHLMNFLGYFSSSPFDSKYWLDNYETFANLTNPFDTYQFMREGRIVETSLAELCLFQLPDYYAARDQMRALIREYSTGDNAIFTRNNFEGPVRYNVGNFRFRDERWNDPKKWFDFPHRTDVYSPSTLVFAGVPLPKTDLFNGWKPTENIFSSERFSNDSYWRFVDSAIVILNNLCVAANVNPNILSAFFTVKSPGPNNADYIEMDRIARNVANDHRSELRGIVGDVNVLISHPRYFWANPPDSDTRDRNLAYQLYSDALGIPLFGDNSTAFMAYSCDYTFPIVQSDPSGNRQLTRPVLEYLEAFEISLNARAPFARNLGGTRIYADAVGAALQIMNLFEFLKDSEPQLLLHSSMSFDNALKKMAMRQLGSVLTNPNIIGESDYERIWQLEVQARDNLPSGQGGYMVPLHSEITINNIGTMALFGGGVAARNGGYQIGAILMASGALLSLINEPGYGEVLTRAADIEMIRQDGSNTLDSTIYRPFTARQILSTVPVMRIE